MLKKTSPNDPENMVHRLNRAIGQLEAIKRMVEEQKPGTCKDVVYQVKAVRSALKRVSDLYVAMYVEKSLNQDTHTTQEKKKILETLQAALES